MKCKRYTPPSFHALQLKFYRQHLIFEREPLQNHHAARCSDIPVNLKVNK